MSKSGEIMRLADYDIILINSSAGKDSQAMLDYVYSLAVAEDVADRITVVHADLGRAEWSKTKELAAEQAAHYGARFEVVSRPQGDLLDHIQQRRMFPSSSARYCMARGLLMCGCLYRIGVLRKCGPGYARQAPGITQLMTWAWAALAVCSAYLPPRRS
jgi:hypothetical protein